MSLSFRSEGILSQIHPDRSDLKSTTCHNTLLCISSLYLSLLFIQYIQESVQIFMIVKFNFDLTGSLSLRCNCYFSSKLLFQFFFNILVDYLHGFIIYFLDFAGLCKFLPVFLHHVRSTFHQKYAVPDYTVLPDSPLPVMLSHVRY